MIRFLRVVAVSIPCVVLAALVLALGAAGGFLLTLWLVTWLPGLG